LLRPTLQLPKTILTKSELLDLFDMPDTSTLLGYRNRMILELLYATGMRHAELFNLSVSDISFETATVLIQHGKGGHDRVVPLNATALKFIRHYIDVIRPQLLSHSTTKRLIVSIYGTTSKRPKLGELLQPYFKKIKKPLSIHTFRHTFATHMLQNGMPLRHVQELLGHAKLQTTTRYLHLNIKDLQREYTKFHPRGRGEYPADS
jgi:integrase/recombinase XerD